MTRSIILPGQKIAGFPKAKKPRTLATDNLINIFATHWREDVHFTQYAVIESIGPYRYNNEIFKSPGFEEAKKSGESIEIICVAFDIDSPAKKSGEAGAVDLWFELERPKIQALLEAHPGGFVWRTKGGWRGVWNYSFRIGSADDAAMWKKNYLAAIVYLQREFGIIADPACNDWNRLHRVPFGIRENEANFGWGEPIIRETIGTLSGTFDVVGAPTEADRTEARRVHLNAWKSVTEITSKVAKADEPSKASVIDGPFVWEKILRNRNAITRELAPGKWAIRCANEQSHSTQSDTSTVLYAPGPGECIGHIYCAHAHCAGLDWRSAWGVAASEWDAALAETLASAPPAANPSNAILDPAAAEELAAATAVAGLVQGRDGMPAPIAGNVAHILLHHPEFKGKLAYDAFRNERVWLEFPKAIRGFRNAAVSYLQLESDLTHIQGWFHKHNPRISVSIESVRAGIQAAADSCQFDSLRQYSMSFNGLWDGTPRLDTWLIDYMGAEDTALNRAMGRRWLMAAFARALLPGCVADMFLVLEGEGGIGKNLMLETLFGEKFVANTHGVKLGSKDFIQKASTAWVVHDDELESYNQCTLGEVKAWVTIKRDEFRKAHAVDFISAYRRYVIVGSTNDSDYMKDTSNRRIWPIKVTKFQFHALQRDRELLLSEALAYFMSRGNDIPWLISGADPLWSELESAHSGRRIVDGFEAIISQAISDGNLKIPFTSNTILELLQIPIERRDMRMTLRVTKVLREVLKFERKQVKTNGLPIWYWFRKGVALYSVP